MGGETKLKAAVSRGAVKVHYRQGVQMFVFPSVTSSMKEKITQAFQSKADLPASEEPYHGTPKPPAQEQKKLATHPNLPEHIWELSL